MKTKLFNILRSAMCLVILDGCGGTLGGNPEFTSPDEAGTGTEPALSFAITDAPVEDAQNVFVSIASVEIANATGEWVTIPMKIAEEIDLLKLQDGTSEALAAIDSLAAGTYSQTRLVLSADKPARLIDLSNVEHILKVPSGSESGLKIQSSFTKEEGIPLVLTIDFDLRKSIQTNSNGNGQGSDKYMLKPVLRLVDNDQTGSIIGAGKNNSIVCVFTQGSGPTAAGDDSCASAISSAKVKAGYFKLAFLPAGTYELRSFGGENDGGVVQNILVKAGQETDAGTLPIKAKVKEEEGEED